MTEEQILSPGLSNLIEKAHLLAASGRYLSVSDIRSALHREGFTHFELTALNGKAIRMQLRKLIVAATASKPDATLPSTQLSSEL